MSTSPQFDIAVQRIVVPFEYPVAFTRDLLAPANPLLVEILQQDRSPEPRRVLCLVDEGLAAARPELEGRLRAYLDVRRPLAAPADIARLPGGEQAKQGWDTVHRAIALMHGARLCRHSYVVAIGGGGVLDAAGLAAALVHRGLRLVRVPTTVVAQCDVGVGVKNGIDALGAKNYLGTFAPPYAVLNDLDFLDSLPWRDWIGGIAEAFKVAMIKDADFFACLCGAADALRARDRTAMETAVRRCAALHLDHIREGGDPFEMGSARPLDFGHWSAHQVEVLSAYAVNHGEAVAIGIALDAYYAWRTGLLRREDLDALLRGLQACGLPVWHPLLERRAADGRLAVLDGLEQFREHLGGELTVTLPQGVGRRVEVHALDPALIEEGIAFLAAQQADTGRTALA